MGHTSHKLLFAKVGTVPNKLGQLASLCLPLSLCKNICDYIVLCPENGKYGKYTKPFKDKKKKKSFPIHLTNTETLLFY